MKKIELADITKSYIEVKEGYKDKRIVLDRFNYKFKEGKMYGIMGPSGAGKSTLLNIMAGLETLDGGSVTMDSQCINQLTKNQKADFRKEHIGFIFQSFYLNPYISVIENVMVPMLVNDKIPKSERKTLAYEKLKDFGVEEHENKKVRGLSGGEEQRVAIARAMANNPDVILADEPTGNLDEDNEKIVFEYLKNLSESGKIVIVVSHNEAVKDYADEIIFMNKIKRK